MMCYVSELYTETCWLVALVLWRPSRVCRCSSAWVGKDWMGWGHREDLSFGSVTSSPGAQVHLTPSWHLLHWGVACLHV